MKRKKSSELLLPVNRQFIDHNYISSHTTNACITIILIKLLVIYTIIL